jgi:hypothetical protein
MALAAALGLALPASDAQAYTAAGDRLFPATLLLPQITPGDEFYINLFSLPDSPSGVGTTSHAINLTGTLQKTLTERLGVSIDETWTRLDQAGGGALYGWQNTDTSIKYLAVLDWQHEFVFTAAVDREFGGTGALRAGADASGATTPEFFFGKGMGDLDIGFLRPLALAGFAGYQIADRTPRPNIVTGGFVLEYSIPYLESKVQALDLPDYIRNLTPMTEIAYTIPGGESFGARTTALIAPGISYAGEGWEIAVEGLVPATRATGRGIGVTAQFHLSLDYLAPDTVGRPLFSGP